MRNLYRTKHLESFYSAFSVLFMKKALTVYLLKVEFMHNILRFLVIKTLIIIIAVSVLSLVYTII